MVTCTFFGHRDWRTRKKRERSTKKVTPKKDFDFRKKVLTIGDGSYIIAKSPVKGAKMLL